MLELPDFTPGFKSPDLMEQMPLNDVVHIQRIDLWPRQQFGTFRDDKGMVQRVRGPAAVGTFDKPGIKRNDVHEHSETKFLLQKTPQNFKFHSGCFWVEE